MEVDGAAVEGQFFRGLNSSTKRSIGTTKRATWTNDSDQPDRNLDNKLEVFWFIQIEPTFSGLKTPLQQESD
jgi:hypothetical protein